MKETTQQFAQRIRTKYPGAYDDKPDEDLVKAYVKKYPVYADRVDLGTSKTKTPEKPKEKPKPTTLEDKARELPGVKQIAAVGDFQSSMGRGLVKSVTGAAKSTVLGLANLIGKGTNKLMGSDRYQPVTNKQFEKNASEMGPLAKPFTEAKGAGEKIGKAVGDIGMFFAPGGAVTKGAKAVQGAKVLSQTPKLAKVAGFGAKVAGEALSAGGVTAIQGGDKQAVKTAATIGGAFPIAGKVAEPVAKFLSQKLAPTFVNRTLRPLAKQFSFGKNPGAGVVGEGLKANTIGTLEQRIISKKQAIGQEIETILNKPEVANKIIDVAPLLAPIDDAIQQATKRGEQDLINRYLQIKSGLIKEFDLVGDKLVEKGVKNLKLSPAEAQKLKREIGEATRWTGQAFDNDINQVRVALYRGLDDAIDLAAPGIEKLNSRWANMLSAEKAIERIKHQLQSKFLTATEKGIGATVGLGTAAASGQLNLETAIKSIFFGALGAGGSRLINSAGFNTRIASGLAKLGPSEKQKVIEVLPLLKNIFLGTINK